MAIEHSLTTISLKAAESLSNKQFYFVKLTGAGNIGLPTAATNLCCGVVQNNPDANETAVIAVGGLTKVSADASLTAGNLVGPSADGQADAKTPGSDTGEYIMGQVVKGVASAGSLASIILGGVPFRGA